MHRNSVVILLLVWFSGLFALTAQAASDLTIASLNTLHLNWGKPQNLTNRCAAIDELLKKSDIVLLQEVMKTNIFTCTLTTDFGADCSALKGASTYKEAYCFVYRKTKTSTNPSIAVLAMKDAPSGYFSRPPYAIFTHISLPNNTTQYMWFVNIHSIFGSQIKARQDEATAAGAFFNQLATSPVVISSGTILPPNGVSFPIAIGGDWNIAITNGITLQHGFEWVSSSASPNTDPDGCPKNDPTSLTNNGTPSSPYDHIIISTKTLTGDTNCHRTIDPALNMADWRKNVSDHMAIYWGVKFK
ncbi:endonuclease/exonuclease/phosphatase family protein [Pectobacterium polaris]|uniref:endonuclease/exonuclease/phosphatase family protein n=1 Tax=Pectobacterium polaris TaxID=2042057 RepID=UPI001F3BE886|nr:endonuclease/exonuclease/phosphatase family protein [Pectobacterium polaris]